MQFEKNELIDKLFEAVLKLKTTEECYAFFNDLCTVVEIEAMSIRLEAAKKLLEGRTYEEIQNTVNISSATLSRVSKALQYGKDGYKMIIQRVSRKNF